MPVADVANSVAVVTRTTPSGVEFDEIYVAMGAPTIQPDDDMTVQSPPVRVLKFCEDDGEVLWSGSHRPPGMLTSTESISVAVSEDFVYLGYTSDLGIGGVGEDRIRFAF